jgi:hypothetical protein
MAVVEGVLEFVLEGVLQLVQEAVQEAVLLVGMDAKALADIIVLALVIQLVVGL